MINKYEFIKSYQKRLSNLRGDFKRDVQKLIDEKEINYEQAISIFEYSELFKIQDCIINDGIFEEYIDYNDNFCRYETIYFSQISDWINDDDEGCITEMCEDKGINKEDLQKEIYDTIISDNIIGFIYD